MTTLINYTKMHGLGNDFVIVNTKDLSPNIKLSSLAKSISHRHLGVGCDQFILYSKHHNYLEMQIYNSDGSLAKTCGNAARCLAKLTCSNKDKQEIVIKISDRELKCKINKLGQVSVNMGQVSFDEKWMPPNTKIWDFTNRYQIDPKEVLCVDVSNPHIVIFTELTPADQEIIGCKLQEDEFVLGGVNVNFAQVTGDIISLKVWERGTGFTMACGSGACASFAAAKKLGYIDKKAKVIFELGDLQMSEEKDNIVMCGPANLVSQGEYYYA